MPKVNHIMLKGNTTVIRIMNMNSRAAMHKMSMIIGPIPILTY
jgi:hypothetical protein